MHVVVFQERDPALERGVAGELVDALQHFLPRVVGRMRLAGEHDLHRPPGAGEQPAEPVEIAEDEVRALVGGEPAREADGERAGIEEGARADDLCRLAVLAGEPMARVLADMVEQHRLEPHVSVPELARDRA